MMKGTKKISKGESKIKTEFNLKCRARLWMRIEFTVKKITGVTRIKETNELTPYKDEMPAESHNSKNGTVSFHFAG